MDDVLALTDVLVTQGGLATPVTKVHTICHDSLTALYMDAQLQLWYCKVDM